MNAFFFLSELCSDNSAVLAAIVLISKYVMKGWKEVQGAYADKENSEEVIKVLSYLEAVEKVKHSADEMEVSHLIEEHSLEREQLLTDHLRSKVVSSDQLVFLTNSFKGVLRSN